MKIAFVIPARYKSKRLPGKPLKKILGVPMLSRTVKQCLKAVDKKDLFVLTDTQKIKNFCKSINTNCIVIKKKSLTGTDRIAHFAGKNKKYTNFINVQGDEPVFNPADLKKIIKVTKKNNNLIYGGYCKIKEKNDYINSSIPKVVFDKNENLMYMSRAAIPSNKKKKFIKSYRQVCIYSFPKRNLKKFLSFKKKSFLENLEDLELLRFVENGINVKMIKLSDKSISVDVPRDIKKVERFLKRKK